VHIKKEGGQGKIPETGKTLDLSFFQNVFTQDATTR
jgi:hypothetical protein